MGLFSSKTKISVFANSYQMMYSNPNSLKDAVLLAILSDKSIATSITNTCLNSMSTRINHMRTYAENEYALGLSTGYHSNTLIMDEDVLADIIATDISHTDGVIVDINYITPLSLQHIAVPHLLSMRGWHPLTDVVTSYPSGLSLPDSPDSSTAVYVVKITSVELSIDFLNIEITYEIKSYYQSPPTLFSTTSYQEDYTIPTGFELGKNYCIAGYRLLDSEGTPADSQDWWFYAIDSEKYPAISISKSLNEANNSLPVIPLRHNNQDMARSAVQSSNLYLTSKKLLKKVSVDFDTIADTINTNPNVAEIDHAYIMFGADLQSTHNEVIYYLVEFFDHLADIAAINMFENMGSVLDDSNISQNLYAFNGNLGTGSSATSSHSWIGPGGETVTTTIVNNATVSTMIEYGLNVSITYSYVRSEFITGSIGSIGTASKSWIRGSDSNRGFGTLARLFVADNSTLILKLQIEDNVYKQITVQGLSHTNRIYAGHNVITTLTDVIDSSDEHNFIIPIHYGVSTKIPLIQRSMLYEESFMIVMNSYVITKIKWYQTGIFKALLMAAGLVIAAISSQYWLIGLIDAAAVGATAVLMYVLQSVVIGLALTQIGNFIAQEIGPEAAAILSTVVTLATLYINPAGSIKVATFSLPTAQVLLSLSSAVISGAHHETQERLAEVKNEYDIFKEESTTKADELEVAMELLTEPSLLSENLLDYQTKRYGLHPLSSEPEKFYNFTIHTGNVGTFALEAIPQFYNIMLQLPEADNFAYGNTLNPI